MEEKKKRYYIKAEVTKKERDKIRNEADKQKTTITAIILNSLENNITVNLDTSDYRDLVIQFRRIGNNINNIIKDIRFNNYFTDTDMLIINNNLKELKKQLNDEKIKINKVKKDFESLSPRKLREILEKENKEIPLYLIYDEIVDHINLKLRSFVDLINHEKWQEGYTSYIEIFIRDFHPTNYSYNELVNFSNDLDNIIYTINQKIIARTGNLTEKDFMNVMNVLNKYRKDID